MQHDAAYQKPITSHPLQQSSRKKINECYSQLSNKRLFCGSRVAAGLESVCEIKASMLRQSCGQNVAYVEFNTTSTTFASQPAHAFTDAWREHDTDGIHSKPALAVLRAAPSATQRCFLLYIYHIYSYICIHMSISEMETTLDISRQLNDTKSTNTICHNVWGWDQRDGGVGRAGQRSR